MSEETRYDPVTIELIQSSLDAISDEMFATMRKTAVSSIIYEVLDFGVAITDRKGFLASSGAGIPAFVGMLDYGVRAIVNKFSPKGDIHPGDIFVANIPHFGGVSHMNDVMLILPVFAGGELLAWVANKAHWADVGGMAPSSIHPDATEVFQEGLQLPEIKLFERGVPIASVMDIIMANSRMPETARGDLWAGVASMKAGERRIQELAAKYGIATVAHAIERFLDYGEGVARQALRRLPKGTFAAEDRLDDGRVLRASITITDEEFIVDLRGNPPQDRGPLNCSFASTEVDAKVLFKAVTSPDTPANAGSFRPLKLICDERSLFNAQYPAAMGLYYEVGIRALDIIWKALAPHLPDRLTAGHYASVCGTFVGGTHPDTGKRHVFIEPQLGGWGGADGADGDSAQYTASHGDTFNCAVEVTEARNGVRIDRLELNDEPGGEGEYRGGKGIRLDYRIRGDDFWITAMYSRSEVAPWGLRGGRDGSLNYIRILRRDGTEARHSTCAVLPLKRDDVVRIVTANGGGYGDPRQRPRELVLADLKDGYITPRVAREVYGIEIDGG
jgi:N-methylhydantoinase B